MLSAAQALISPIPSREGMNSNVMMFLLKYNHILDKLFFEKQTNTLGFVTGFFYCLTFFPFALIAEH